MLTIYKAFFKIQLLNQLQYRAAMAIWMTYRVLEPLIYVAVWTTVARSQGGSVGGRTPEDFAAYYIVLMFVNQITFTWIMHEFEFRIRTGSLSPLLLKPVHPIHDDIASNVAYKVITIVILVPAALLLTYLFKPTFTFTTYTTMLCILSLALAFITRFLLEWTLALVAFWTTRVSAINQIYFVLALFLSGRIAPIDLLPGWVRFIADILPFRWTMAFPTELMLGSLTPSEIQHGFIVLTGWLIIGFLLLKFAWSRGVRAYSAVGS
jgi:ABC-2 type transport system permease protein